ncbi:Homoserine kinase [Frankliniella fusca]|uniref:Homoserine kinase n=1 Tax=Frankliniella fusca TaxID=407009 RepID=A0AAE1H805_9NEOP|nr:Homoserine kinase [Frankliniella fusca]
MPKKTLKKRFRIPRRRLANDTKKSSTSSIEFSIPEPSTSNLNPGECQSSAINLRNMFTLTKLSKPTQNSSSRRKQLLTPKINEENSGYNEDIMGSPCLTSAGETCPVEEVENSFSSTAVEEDGHILTSISDAIPLELT